MPSYPSRFAVVGGYCGYSQKSCGKKYETVSVKLNLPPPSNTEQQRFNMFIDRVRNHLMLQNDNHLTMISN